MKKKKNKYKIKTLSCLYHLKLSHSVMYEYTNRYCTIINLYNLFIYFFILFFSSFWSLKPKLILLEI